MCPCCVWRSPSDGAAAPERAPSPRSCASASPPPPAGATASHAREQSRFALEVESDAPAALALALESWRVQREPWDARLVLAAARAAGALPPAQRAAVEQVERFVAERGPAWRAVAGGGVR